jgi:heat shock protein 4
MLARQAEKPKNVNPVITSAEMLKRRDDVTFTCAAIMNRPKPKAKTTEAPKEEPKKEEPTGEDGGPTIEEMDVD